MPKFGTKIPDLGIFGLQVENNIVVFEINIQDFLIANFRKKMKIPKCGTKNAIF